MKTVVLFAGLAFSGCATVGRQPARLLHDHHVHVMSPQLIAEWKALGIPFSRPDAYYASIDSILKNNRAEVVDAVSMAYVYGSAEFSLGGDEYEKVKQENNFIFSVAQKHPTRIRPFYTVDPLKEYTQTELQRCLRDLNMKGVKLHFSASQVYLTVPDHVQKVKPVFRFAAENQLPVLLHFDNWHPKFGQPDIAILVDSILADIPALTLTIAHFGSSGGFNEKTKRVLDEFARLFHNDGIPARHRILFDISAVALDKDSEGVPRLTPAEFKELRTYIDKIGTKRILFGTDYPLYTSREYIRILKEKVGLKSSEVKQILKNSLANSK